MSDVFLSYDSEDRERVIPLVRALEATGWSIFWDRTIPVGRTWREVISQEIRDARSIIVVWSNQSINSDWVHEEAEEGKRRGILIPVQIDAVPPPFGFGAIQAADLTAWDGSPNAPLMRGIVAGLTPLLGTVPAEQARRGAEKMPEKEELKLSDEGQVDAEKQRYESETRREVAKKSREKETETRSASGQQKRTQAEVEAKRFHEQIETQKQDRSALHESPVDGSQGSRPIRTWMLAGFVFGLVALAVWGVRAFLPDPSGVVIIRGNPQTAEPVRVRARRVAADLRKTGYKVVFEPTEFRQRAPNLRCYFVEDCLDADGLLAILKAHFPDTYKNDRSDAPGDHSPGEFSFYY